MTQAPKSKTAELYNERYEQFGRDIRTVGWGSQADQELRFAVLFRDFEIKGKSVLDVGCGLGDLVPYLEKMTGGDFRYIGIDIAEKLVDDARATYGGPSREFHLGDVLSLDLPQCDFVVLSGALSFKSEGIEEYAKRVMQKMFDLSSEAACLNFLTSYVDFQLDKNQHYSPETIFAEAKKLSRNVNLIHDYPLWEFTVQILKATRPRRETSHGRK